MTPDPHLRKGVGDTVSDNPHWLGGNMQCTLKHLIGYEIPESSKDLNTDVFQVMLSSPLFASLMQRSKLRRALVGFAHLVDFEYDHVK